MAGIEWSVAERLITLSTWMFIELHSLPLPAAVVLVVVGVLLAGIAVAMSMPRFAIGVDVVAQRFPPVAVLARGAAIGVGFRPVGGRGARAPGAPSRSAPAV